MKNNFKSITVFFVTAVLATPAAFAQSTSLSLEDRVAELEANQSLNIFKFSGFLNTRYDDVNAEQTTPASSAFESHTQHMRLRAGINANAEISKSLNFYSTLTASKYFNTWATQPSGVGTIPTYLNDALESRDENGSLLYLEKAYADYRFTDRFTFSFGRLPTMDGPPSHMPQGKARMGTYPSMGYNAPFDGLALSFNQPLDNQSISFRALYTPMSYYTTSAGKLGGAPEGLGNVTIAGSKINSMSDFYSLMFEYNLGQTVVANKFNFILMHYQTGQLSVDGSLFNAGGGAGSGLVDSRVGGQVAVAELSQIMDTNFDLAVTYLQTQVDNSGTITIPGLGSIYGLGASSEGETLKGNSTLISARYKWANLFIGAEYLIGGKNVFNYDPASETVNGFYSTPGKGMHAYGLYKLTPELGVRLGYMKQDYDSTPFTFGASGDTDREITTYYTDLRLDF